MKKFLLYILIVIIFAQLLVPFTIGSGEDNKIAVRVNTAEATDAIRVTTTAFKSDTTITGTVRVVWWNKGFRTNDSGVIINLTDPVTKTIIKSTPSQQIKLTNLDETLWTYQEKSGGIDSVQTGEFKFTGLKPSTDYVLNTVALQSVTTWWEIVRSATSQGTVPAMPEINTTTIATPLTITTEATGYTQSVPAGSQIAVNDETILPTCSWNSSDTWGGCFGRMFYWILFKPTSYIFGLTGKLLDVSVDYSTKDTSYRSAFVTEGWGVVRDFCNMFFIFVMLYIAFGTILKIHSVKTKEMIINVVIIGLLLNFSLFATQVIIDASNILTRVFYNSQTIQVGPKVDGVVQEEKGSQNELQLSSALVSKINPQKLILEAYKADNIQTAQTVGTSAPDNNGVSASTFILVTLLASIVNIVGMITFLTCALIFISRVVGLWLAMIFAPLAFFSYTIPALQDIEMVGWKRWWPDLLKMAFLAPVFVFFIYLIIKFLDTGLGLLINDKAGGLDFILGIFVPFIFIMILLTKAKDIASKMSGEIGQQITNGLKAAGGIALGGAAIGTAMIGKRVIGQTMAKASRGDTATQKYDAANKLTDPVERTAAMKELSWVQKGKGIVGNKIGLGKIYGETTQNGKTGVRTVKDGSGIGGYINKKQKDVGGIDHGRHEDDELKKAAGVVDASGNVIDNKLLTGQNITAMQNKYKQQKQGEAEAAARKGTDIKGKSVLLEEKNASGAVTASYRGAEEFKKSKMDELIAERKTNNNPNDFVSEKITDKKGNVTTRQTDQLKPEVLDRIKNELDVKLSALVKVAAEEKLNTDFSHIRTESTTKVGMVDRGIAGANKNSYDLRKLSELKSDKREGMFTKIPIALISAVAMGVRGGIKSAGMSNGGVKVEGNFMKDLGNTISDSLKSMKVNVDLGHVGETKSSADAHGGGGGAHH